MRFPENVFNIWRAEGGGVWINTMNALYRWEHGKWMQKLKSSSGQLKLEGSILLENKDGQGFASVTLPLNMWGLWEWGGKPGRPFSLIETGVSVKTATIDSAGSVVVVYESGFVQLLHKGQFSAINFRQPHVRDIECVRYRSNGDLWIGTQRGLFLYKHSSQRWTYSKHESPDPRNSVHEIIKARDGSLWFATSNGLDIHRPDGTSESITSIRGEALFVVTGLVEDNDNCIWISSGSSFEGAYRWNGRRWDRFGLGTPLQGNKIHKIRKDSRGRLWFLAIWPSSPAVPESLATLGAYVYEKGKLVQHWAVDDGLLDNQVYSFAESEDGTLWFGTAKGLSRWRKHSWTHWRLGRESRVLPLVRVFTICADKEGSVWFGDRLHGLGRIDTTDSISVFGVADGLINDEVWDIRSDTKGRLWIATSGGLSCYYRGVWTSIDSRTGLLSSELWPVVPIEDKLYVGSRGSGVSILDLSSLSEQPKPIVNIERPATEKNSAVLRWKPLAFWGDPSPENIATRYRINDGRWSRWSTDHNVTINDLSPGGYAFQVQAIDIAGSYDVSGQQVRFTIERPLYEHPLVILPVGSLILLAITFGATLYTRKRKHDDELRKSEAKFRAITETTSSAILIYSESKILFANPSAAVLTGYAEEELAKMSIFDLIHPAMHVDFRSKSLSFRKSHPTPIRFELKIVTREGVERWIDYSEGRVEFNGAASTVGTGFDISERKEAERKILANQEQLRSLASELSSTEERERRRMAVFLHDSIGQALALCKIKLGTIQRAAEKAGLEEAIKEIRSFVDLSIRNTRSLTFELSPPILDELGLTATIEWIAEQMQSQYGVRISIQGEKEKYPLNDEVRALLFHAVRELLVNVVKHSHATNVVINVIRKSHDICITVADNGVGLEPEGGTHRLSANRGFGLFSIRERLMHLGGQMEIDAAPGRGTRVTLQAPLAAVEGQTTTETAL
jgi:PAS domain S-box-containing protein